MTRGTPMYPSEYGTPGRVPLEQHPAIFRPKAVPNSTPAGIARDV